MTVPSRIQTSTGRCERVKFALLDTSGQDTRVVTSLERERAVVGGEITETDGRESSSMAGEVEGVDTGEETGIIGGQAETTYSREGIGVIA